MWALKPTTSGNPGVTAVSTFVGAFPGRNSSCGEGAERMPIHNNPPIRELRLSAAKVRAGLLERDMAGFVGGLKPTLRPQSYRVDRVLLSRLLCRERYRIYPVLPPHDQEASVAVL